MLEIKVLGFGCLNCKKVEQLVINVCANNKFKADIQKVTDFKEYGQYGVMMTPGLVINGKTVSQGKIPSENMVEQWLIEALN